MGDQEARVRAKMLRRLKRNLLREPTEDELSAAVAKKLAGQKRKATAAAADSVTVATPTTEEPERYAVTAERTLSSSSSPSLTNFTSAASVVKGGGKEEKEGKEGIEEEEEEKEEEEEEEEEEKGGVISKKTFQELGLDEILCESCASCGYTAPTGIQSAAIPAALSNRDVIGLAETGSGKTAAFALPVLQALLEARGNTAMFAVVMAPARELAFQIRDTFNALGASIRVRTAVIVGGMDLMTQQIALSKKPHIIVATPGRLVDHLENTKGFHLKNLKFLIMDEADRMLNMDFEREVDQILRVIPRDRRTFLFSATMTSKVAKLQRASLRDPIRVEVNSKYKTVDRLIQRYIFTPQKFKDCYLTHLLSALQGNSFMIFCSTCNNAQRTTLLLRDLGLDALCLHGQMSQAKRLGALSKFTAQGSNILVATDVASRGLDIPHVDVVVNFDIPTHSKDYIHRVGRTARAGRSGRAVTFVTQYDIELFQRIEQLIGLKMEPHSAEESEVMLLLSRVTEAARTAALGMRAIHERREERRGGGGGGGKRPKFKRHQKAAR